MTDMTDMELLRNYGRQGSEEAFATLVQRHVNLVFSIALRHVGIPAHAEEITQAVFIVLARKAASLRPDTILEGWLYQTTRLTSLSFLRGERRRQSREQEAYMQSTFNESQNDSVWDQMSPLLDEALSRLRKKDRDAVILRFFKNKNLGEVAAALKVTEAAAQSRVHRSLEKLHRYFSKRGVSSTTAVIAGKLSVKSVHAAPIVLAKSVTAVAITKGAVPAASTLTLVKGTMRIMTWMKMKFALTIGSGLVIALLAATAIFAQNENQKTIPPASSINGGAILITPGVSVGEVKAGMTEDEVAAVLGKPEKMQGEVMIYDQQFGFSVVCSRKKIVGAVFCGDSMLNNPGVEKFTGHTKEGIGMKSGREDVIKAFGQPTTASTWDASLKQEQIEYRSLGLTFLLEKGRVFHITVDLRKPQ